MGNINMILAIDIIVLLLGVYLLFLSIRMKTTRSINKFIIPEEDLKKCNQPEALAEYLSGRMLFFSVIIILCAATLVVDEVLIDIGIGTYFVAGILLIAYVLFYKQIGDAKVKYC